MKSIIQVFFFSILAFIYTPFIIIPQSAGDNSKSDDFGIKWVKVEGGLLKLNAGGSDQSIKVDSFEISATEITVDQYNKYSETVLKEKHFTNEWETGSHPVSRVSYDDAVQYCKWLAAQTGRNVRLPNEVEWMFAAQGGNKSRNYKYSGSNYGDEIAWNENNSNGTSHKVGEKKGNELGIFDMNGNLWEWCTFFIPLKGKKEYSDSKTDNNNEKYPVFGNSFDNPTTENDSRIKLLLNRNSRHINLGFRIVRTK